MITWVYPFFAPYLDLLLSIGRDGQLHTSIYDKRDYFNFHITDFPFLSSNIPSSQAFTSLSLHVYDTPGRSPYMNVLFRELGDFPVSYSNRDTSWNAWNRNSGSFMVDTGILFSNMMFRSHECWMTFWPLTSYSDFPTYQTFHQFHDLDTELDLHLITSGFHGAFATDVAFQHGMRTLPETWFRPHFRDLLMLQLLTPVLPNLTYLFSTFNLDNPSVLSRFCLSLSQTP